MNLFNLEWGPSAMEQKVSHLKVRNCGKHYHQQYGILKPFINLKIKLKTGTAKTFLASYAAYLFLTWAIYDFWTSVLNCIFWWLVVILSSYIILYILRLTLELISYLFTLAIISLYPTINKLIIIEIIIMETFFCDGSPIKRRCIAGSLRLYGN